MSLSSTFFSPKSEWIAGRRGAVEHKRIKNKVCRRFRRRNEKRQATKEVRQQLED